MRLLRPLFVAPVTSPSGLAAAVDCDRCDDDDDAVGGDVLDDEEGPACAVFRWRAWGCGCGLEAVGLGGKVDMVSSGDIEGEADEADDDGWPRLWCCWSCQTVWNGYCGWRGIPYICCCCCAALIDDDDDGAGWLYGYCCWMAEKPGWFWAW